MNALVFIPALTRAEQASVLRWRLTRECMRALARLDPEGQPAREERLARIHELEQQ